MVQDLEAHFVTAGSVTAGLAVSAYLLGGLEVEAGGEGSQVP